MQVIIEILFIKIIVDTKTIKIQKIFYMQLNLTNQFILMKRLIFYIKEKKKYNNPTFKSSFNNKSFNGSLNDSKNLKKQY